MTVIEGGLRIRLIRDALFDLVQDSLTDLGWFDAGRQHQPVRFLPEPLNWDEPIELNTITLTMNDVNTTDVEMGSLLGEERWEVYIDFFCESEAFALHIVNDVRDALRGKLPSIGRTRPTLSVLDRTLATPVEIFTCEIEDVVVDRANNFNRPWMRYLYSIRLDVVDTN